MRSEHQEEVLVGEFGPGQTWVGVRHRVGAILVATISVVMVEAVVGSILLILVRQAGEQPDSIVEFGFLEAVLVAGFSVLAGTVLLTGPAVLAACLVTPLVVLAGWAGRRIGGRESWWWVPAVTAVVLLPLLGGALALGAGLPLASAVWFAATVAVVIPALVVRRLLLSGRPRLTGGAMFLRLAVGGPLAVIVTAVLGGLGLWGGLLYEPPELTRAGARCVGPDGEDDRRGLFRSRPVGGDRDGGAPEAVRLHRR
ncbi:hypothetical protein SLA_4339 [Streptomyces laurentii]|uniref:Uncharacterized protein n=1 Tax=Streptomyces laurentii TaxID=39478 RepID=A0A160P1D0_STRLU|nr:hypothetical protein SLA_4339 [Streptomyces laurentii]